MLELRLSSRHYLGHPFPVPGGPKQPIDGGKRVVIGAQFKFTGGEAEGGATE